MCADWRQETDPGQREQVRVILALRAGDEPGSARGSGGGGATTATTLAPCSSSFILLQLQETGPMCGQCTQTLSWSALGVGMRSPLRGWTVEGGTPAYAGGTRLQTSISTVLSMRAPWQCPQCPSAPHARPSWVGFFNLSAVSGLQKN